MSTIVTRSGKGSALSHTEADANFTNLNTDKVETSVFNTHTGGTAAHGTTGDIVGTSDTQTLTNKTITAAGNVLDPTLEDVAGLTPTDSNFIVGDGANFVTESGATARTSLGLGTAAVEDIGTSGTTVPLLSTANIWSLSQDFSANGVVLSKGTFVPTIVGTTTAGTGTYTTQTAQYTEFDDCYSVTINLGWTAHTGTGQMRVSGLPFTTGSNSCGVVIGNMNGVSVGTAGRSVTAEALATNTQIRFLEHDISTGTVAVLNIDTAISSLVLSGVIFK